MEKKVRVKQLNHQDDVKRSWAAAYPLTEDFENIFPNDLEETQSKSKPIVKDAHQIQPAVKQHDSDISEI